MKKLVSMKRGLFTGLFGAVALGAGSAYAAPLQLPPVIAGLLGGSTQPADVCHNQRMSNIVGMYGIAGDGFQSNDGVHVGGLNYEGWLQIACDGSVTGNMALTSADSGNDEAPCESVDLAPGSKYEWEANYGLLTLDFGSDATTCASGVVAFRTDFLDTGTANATLVRLGDGSAPMARALSVRGQVPASEVARVRLEKMAAKY